MTNPQTAQASTHGADVRTVAPRPDHRGRSRRRQGRRGEGARQRHGQAVRDRGPCRADHDVARHRGDDQRPHRADRSSDLAAAERGDAPPGFPEARGTWRGLHYLLNNSETGTTAQDQGAQRLEEGPAARPAARAGIRSERVVQEGLRRGVRRLRWRTVRRVVRRLRVQQIGPGHRAAREDLERCGGGARPVPVGGVAGHAQHGKLLPDRRAA